MNKGSQIFAFIFGAVVGSATVWYYFKKREAVLCDCNEEESDSAVTGPEMQEVEPNVLEYAAKTCECGYTNYAGDIEEKKDTATTDKPYVISPEEFGEIDGYDTNSFTYYADGVLTDDDDIIVDDIDNIIGMDSLQRFGEYEDDSVFVRNDRLRCDYEILIDTRTFSEVIEQNPHKAEV